MKFFIIIPILLLLGSAGYSKSPNFGPNNSYPKAELEYINYLKLFPNSEKKDYVLYQIALCHYAVMGKLERCQESTKKAIEAFQKILLETPTSTYVTDAKAKIAICRYRLAATELRIGIYYVKTFKYEIAEKRLKYLLDTYPDCVNYERAYYFLAESLYQNTIKTVKSNSYPIKITNDNLLESGIYYKKLIYKYPNSRLSVIARKRLTKIKQLEIKN
jgi:outer membrane assembly lipoprotein YfiO